MTRRTMHCASCGRIRRVAARYLCWPCYQRHSRHGTLEQFPVRPRILKPRGEKTRPRRQHALLLITQGLTDAQIADRLNVTCSTVRADLKQLYRELDARNRAHAVAQAFRRDLVPDPEPEPDIDATVRRVTKATLDLVEHVAIGRSA